MAKKKEISEEKRSEYIARFKEFLHKKYYKEAVKAAGEDKALALQQIRDLPAAKAADAQVSMYTYDKPSFTGLVYPTDCYFPSWVIPENHVVTQSAVATYKSLFEKEPRVDKWTFSTNGVSIMGMFGIPCVGFGPGKESEAHAPNEKTWKVDLVRCAAFYATLPLVYVDKFGSS